MSRFISKDGKHAVETSIPTEAAELRRDGFIEQDDRQPAHIESEAKAARADAAPTK